MQVIAGGNDVPGRRIPGLARALLRSVLMMLAAGDKVAVAHRRLFAEDHLRWFIGTVEAYEDGVVRLTGFAWVHDPFAATFVRKDGTRTKLVPLAAGGFFAYLLPRTCVVDALRFEADRDGALWLTDDADFRIDVTEGQRETTRR